MDVQPLAPGKRGSWWRDLIGDDALHVNPMGVLTPAEKYLGGTD